MANHLSVRNVGEFPKYLTFVENILLIAIVAVRAFAIHIMCAMKCALLKKRLVYEWNVTVLRADFMMYLGACQARFEME